MALKQWHIAFYLASGACILWAKDIIETHSYLAQIQACQAGNTRPQLLGLVTDEAHRM